MSTSSIFSSEQWAWSMFSDLVFNKFTNSFGILDTFYLKIGSIIASIEIASGKP
jgi:hypothetical protein